MEQYKNSYILVDNEAPRNYKTVHEFPKQGSDFPSHWHYENNYILLKDEHNNDQDIKYLNFSGHYENFEFDNIEDFLAKGYTRLKYVNSNGQYEDININKKFLKKIRKINPENHKEIRLSNEQLSDLIALNKDHTYQSFNNDLYEVQTAISLQILVAAMISRASVSFPEKNLASVNNYF